MEERFTMKYEADFHASLWLLPDLGWNFKKNIDWSATIKVITSCQVVHLSMPVAMGDKFLNYVSMRTLAGFL